MLPNYDVAHLRNSAKISQRILRTQNPNLIQYIKHSEPIGAIVANDFSKQVNDGIYSGVILGQSGIGDGLTAGAYDGSGVTDLYSSALNDDFNGQEGTVLIYGRIATAQWEDGTRRDLFMLRADGSNLVLARKDIANNSLSVVYGGGGVFDVIANTGIVSEKYFCFATAWSLSADELKFYYMDEDNAFAQIGATATGLGTFVGNLASTTALLGASDTGATNPYIGDLAHFALWNIALTEKDIRYMIAGQRI